MKIDLYNRRSLKEKWQCVFSKKLNALKRKQSIWGQIIDILLMALAIVIGGPLILALYLILWTLPAIINALIVAIPLMLVWNNFLVVNFDLHKISFFYAFLIAFVIAFLLSFNSKSS